MLVVALEHLHSIVRIKNMIYCSVPLSNYFLFTKPNKFGKHVISLNIIKLCGDCHKYQYNQCKILITIKLLFCHNQLTNIAGAELLGRTEEQ